MRGAVFDPEIGLDFDDPANSYAAEVASDQSRAQKGPRGRDSVTREQFTSVAGPAEGGSGVEFGRLAQEKIETRSPGSKPEIRCIRAGTTTSRIAPPIWDWWISRSWPRRSWSMSPGKGSGSV